MLTVSDLMTEDPVAVTSEMSLRDVIRLMKEENYRQLPVVDDGRLVGIITDRDVRLAMNSPIVLRDRWQDEELLDHVYVEGVMTPNPVTVAPDTVAYKAAEMLSVYKFGALPVVEGDLLVGIISVTDFLEYVAAKQPVEIPAVLN